MEISTEIGSIARLAGLPPNPQSSPIIAADTT